MAYPSSEGLVASPEIEIAESGTMLDSKGFAYFLIYINTKKFEIYKNEKLYRYYSDLGYSGNRMGARIA
jgi:hypothetical protein